MSYQSISHRKSQPGEVESADCPGQRLLPMAAVVELTTYSRPSIYRLTDQGRFPVPLQLGDGKIAFREVEILEWINSRPRALARPIVNLSSNSPGILGTLNGRLACLGGAKCSAGNKGGTCDNKS